MDQVYIPQKDYKVLVRCMTYNQSKYIEDALNGFSMQKTDFPFACLVMDDASTDGEQEVIKAWMERECDMLRAENVEIEKSFVTIVPHKTNSSCTFAFYFLKENLYKKGGKLPMITPWREHCEYEALCEGDDYWIDENKLQKQVDFLDINTDYAMCYSPVMYYYQQNCIFSDNQVRNYAESFDSLLFSNTVSTPSTLYRLQEELQYEEEIEPYSMGWKMGDYPRWLYYAHNSKIKCLSNEVFAVYRVLQESASHSSDVYKKLAFIDSSYEICLWFDRWYKEGYSAKLKKTKQTYKLAVCAVNGAWGAYLKTLIIGIFDYLPNVFVVKNYFYLPYYICKKIWSSI